MHAPVHVIITILNMHPVHKHLETPVGDNIEDTTLNNYQV